MKNNNQNKNKGFSLFLTILIISIVLSVVLGLSTILVNQYKSTKIIESSFVAFYAAETGIEKALYEIFGNEEAISHTYEGTLDNNTSYIVYIYCCDTENENCDWRSNQCPILEGSSIKSLESCDAKRFCLISNGYLEGITRTIEIEVDEYNVPPFVCGDSLIDERDDKEYTTVQIGDQCWMAENLAYLPSVSPSSSESIPLPIYYVYGYNGTDTSAAKATSNYQTYGVLYNWAAARNSCPTGWHVPSHDEWTQLTDYLTSNSQYWCGGLSYATGKSMASKTNWNTSSNSCAVGNNLSLNNIARFNILPAGAHYDNPTGFLHINNRALFFTSTPYTGDGMYIRQMEYSSNGLGSTASSSNKKNGFSIRCVKD